MDFLKILWWGVFIGIVMTILQILNVQGNLDAKEFVIISDTTTSPLNIEPQNDNIKLLLKTPTNIYSYIEGFKPTESSWYVGIEGLTGANEKSFLRFLLFSSTFLYFFFVTVILAKGSTIFSTEKDQKIFFTFLIIIYLVVVKILGSL